MPREYDSYSWASDYWKEYGVNEEDQKLMCIGTGILNAIQFRGVERYRLPDEIEELKADNYEDHSTVQELKEKIRTLSQENKMLKDAAWNAQNQNAKLSEKLEKAYSDAQNDREELARLRETLFLSQNPESELPDETVPLPFEIKRRIVICGGHDSFIKQFNQLITGNVRYLNNVKVNEELIRNADAIWIQPNAISHSEYYKVVDLCRKNNRSPNYFLYASARKCAEQVVKEEAENEKDR